MEETKPLQPAQHKRNFLLLLGMLGPAAAWLIYLETTYVLIHFASKSGRQTWLHVTSVIFLLITSALGVISFTQWRKAGRIWPDDAEGGPEADTRTLGAIGVLASIEFSLIVLASWIAIFMIDPFQQ
jgi:hypothetical protein